MDKELWKSLQKYYICLDKINNKWNKITKDTEKSIESLKNYCEQLRCINSKEVDNAEIFKIEFMRDNLIFKINLCIEEEFERINDAVKNLSSLNTELKSRLHNLDNTRGKVAIDDLEIIEIVEGTPRVEKLNILLEWAMASQQYYQQLFNEINGGLKSIKRNDEKTVSELISSFKENQKNKSKIDQILYFTQFLITDT